MKRTALCAVAFAMVLGLPALLPSCVHADPPAGNTPAPQQTTPDSPPTLSSQKPRSSQGSEEPTARKEATPSRHISRGERLARTALSYRGLPYRFGGQSPRSGFDCSGLVKTVCAHWGIYVPRAAHAQFHMGTPVKREALQPGDLVFFKNTYKHGLSHVGIYIGEDKFLHAASRGLGVVVSSLNQSYHKKHYAGARRLNLSKLPPVPGEKEEAERILLDDVSNSTDKGTEIAPQEMPAP